MMTTAIGKAEKTGLRKVSKATAILDRRIQHIRQLFSERIARAEAEYHDAMRRVISAEYVASAATSTDQGTDATPPAPPAEPPAAPLTPGVEATV